jgi:D-alanyl-D-alanine dipeptidase
MPDFNHREFGNQQGQEITEFLANKNHSIGEAIDATFRDSTVAASLEIGSEQWKEFATGVCIGAIESVCERPGDFK